MKNIILIAFLTILATAVGVAAQDDDPVKIAHSFGLVFKTADEKKMSAMLSEDFRYYTNIPCSYKDCDQGAKKADYIKGVIDERSDRGFKVINVLMKPIDPIVNVLDKSLEYRATFVCTLVTMADRKMYQFESVIDYYLRKDQDGKWKITKIENRLVH
jgi:hypothetical protein